MSYRDPETGRYHADEFDDWRDDVPDEPSEEVGEFDFDSHDFLPEHFFKRPKQ